MTTRLWLTLASATVTIVVLTMIVSAIRRDAQEDIIRDMRENNEKIGNNSDAGALDYTDCRSRGMLWDWDRNRCSGQTDNASDRRN